MSYDLVIRGGTVVTESEKFVADVGITGGKIESLGSDLPGGKEEMDASGLLVMPGGIDVHTHLQLPFSGTVSADDFANGTKAAACGGLTTIIDFAIQAKGSPIMDAVRARRDEADGKVCIDYGLHAAITGWNESVRAELAEVVEYGIPSFKMFMIYRNEGWMADDGMLFSALEESRKLGAMVGVHAESAFILDLLVDRYAAEKEKVGAYGHVLSRPGFVEAEAIQRAITWAEATGGRLYIVHMSTGEGVDLVRTAREFGVEVYAETCPQYLLLDDEVFKGKNGHYFATCPQIKKKADSERLWAGLTDGDIQVVATDTCTFNTTQKNMWKGDFRKIPFGLPGVETLLPLMYTYGVGDKRLSIHEFVAVTSTNPARLFGLYPEKGSVRVGGDADLILFDPGTESTLSWENLQTNCDWSPFEGFGVEGTIAATLLGGRIVAKEGRWVGEEGGGKFIERHPFDALD